MSRPNNTVAFKKYHKSMLRLLYTKCILEETSYSRLYFPSAWAWWLLFDLKEAPLSGYGWRMADVNSVVRYVKAGYLEEGYEHKPKTDDWVTQSLVAMISAGILVSNCRNGKTRKFKESRLLERYWAKVELLEVTVDRNKCGPSHSNSYLARRLDNQERILRKICGLIGLDEFSDT